MRPPASQDLCARPPGLRLGSRDHRSQRLNWGERFRTPRHRRGPAGPRHPVRVPGDLLDLDQPAGAEHRQLGPHQRQAPAERRDQDPALQLPRRRTLRQRRRPGRTGKDVPTAPCPPRRAGRRGAAPARPPGGRTGTGNLAGRNPLERGQPRRPRNAAEDPERRRHRGLDQRRRSHPRPQVTALGKQRQARDSRQARRKNPPRRGPTDDPQVRSALRGAGHQQAGPETADRPHPPCPPPLRARHLPRRPAPEAGAALGRLRLHRRRRPQPSSCEGSRATRWSMPWRATKRSSPPSKRSGASAPRCSSRSRSRRSPSASSS